MCCTRLAANTGRKKVAKNRHLVVILTLIIKTSASFSYIVKKQIELEMWANAQPDGRPTEYR